MKAKELRETIAMLKALKEQAKDTAVLDAAIEAIEQDALWSKEGSGREMNIDSTREEFENLDYYKPTDEFDGVVIIPTNELHDSGFRCMKFALINGSEVVGCVGGGSDIIHLNGIGGFGKYNKDFDETLKTGKTRRIDWAIDCLPNGLIRLFCSHKLDIDKFIMSDFILYVK